MGHGETRNTYNIFAEKSNSKRLIKRLCLYQSRNMTSGRSEWCSRRNGRKSDYFELNWYNIEARSRNHSFQGKQNTYYIFWVCVCRLSHLTCKAYAPYCHLACPVLPYFSTLSHKRRDFRKKKVIEHKMCVFIFSTTFVWNISHSKKKSAIYYRKCT